MRAAALLDESTDFDISIKWRRENGFSLRA
jgi:hypothetical protein